MLGYEGRSNRREFMAALGLLTVGPIAWSMAMAPVTSLLSSVLSRTGFLVMAVLLILVSLALAVVVLWGHSVILTRRARDIGWPAWVGVAGGIGFAVLSLFLGPIGFAWIGLMCGLPGRRERTDAEIRAGVFG